MKSAALGALAYVAVLPIALVSRKTIPAFSQLLHKFPFAMQTTDGQFTNQLRDIALCEDITFRPALCCQSFPQTLAAVRSGRFAAIVPTIALQELPSGSVHKISGEPLRQLQREIILVWNPRITKVRPHAAKVITALQSTLRF